MKAKTKVSTTIMTPTNSFEVVSQKYDEVNLLIICYSAFANPKGNLIGTHIQCKTTDEFVALVERIQARTVEASIEGREQVFIVQKFDGSVNVF